MAAITAEWSAVPADAVDTRRRALIVSASAAAALLIAGSEPLRQVIAASALAQTPADIVRRIPARRWGWTVELAVLQQLDRDRPRALALLWAALELDLLRAHRRKQPALRLYDLYAAASDAAGRAELAALVTANSRHPALLARAALWSDPARSRRTRLWQTVTRDGQPQSIRL
ncbi:MAG: hypothetical protein ABL879_11555 [Devosia sp.]